MCKQILLVLSPTLLISTSVVVADQPFSMEHINASLQMEYQSQLVLQTKAPPKKIVVKKPSVRHQPQYQPPVQGRATSSLRQPVAKKYIPQADELFEAATYGNVNLIGRLLQQGINVNIANNERETALHMAAANGRYSAVIYLINHGANIHSRTIKNWLPIHHAARFRKANIANYLVQKGSSPHAKTSDGLSAIDMARTVRDQQLLRIFGTR